MDNNNNNDDDDDDETIQITVEDISNITMIIDAVTIRGAFQASELESVGSYYNRMKKFVKQNTPSLEETEENESNDDNNVAE